VDLAGWTVTDSDPTHIYTLAAGATIAAGGYIALDNPGEFTFGLGGADAVHLYNASHVEIDALTWTADPTGSYSRCPNGTGAFSQHPLTNNGTANSCQ
jgi:hypothetical protein